MEQTKHKSIPFEKTVDVRHVIGRKVLTNDGKKLGKIKSIRVHPNDLTVEGILVDTGMFEIDQYIDENYIQSLSGEGAVLKVTPATQLLGLMVYDSTGKEIGKVKEIKRSKLTNTFISLTVDVSDQPEDFHVTPDYIAAIGKGIMLKEPVNFKSK